MIIQQILPASLIAESSLGSGIPGGSDWRLIRCFRFLANDTLNNGETLLRMPSLFLQNNSFSSKRSSIKEIQPCILSSIIGFVSPILTTLFNRCISLGLYPDCLKVAKVTPIFKAGDKSMCSNYRPISILSTFNKSFE